MAESFKSFQDFRKRYPIIVNDETILGSGSYGKVVKVEDQVETEWVAIKIAEYKGKDYKSIKEEVELAQSLPRHPNIARYDACFRFDTDTGINDFAIMKYYADGNLAHLIQNTIFTQQQIKDLVRGILLGLKHLHKNRIVHRDFKPANILISRDNSGRFVPKIADFGLSKLVKEEEFEQSDFELSDGRGTPAYKAPEQIEGGRISFNLDLWAFGVILYEILTKKKLFPSEIGAGESATRHDIERRIIKVDINNQIEQIEEPYRNMIRQCLIKDIRKRVRTENELLDILDNIPVLFDEAKTLFTQQKYDEAKNIYQKILTLREKNAKATEGIKKCNEAIENKRINDLLEKGKVNATHKQWQAAIATFEEILVSNPTHTEAIQQIDLAKKAWAKEKEIDKLFALAEELRQKQQFESAITQYQKILKLDLDNEQASKKIAFCQEQIEKQKEEQKRKEEAEKRAIENRQIEEPTDVYVQALEPLISKPKIGISQPNKELIKPNRKPIYIGVAVLVVLIILSFLWLKDEKKPEIPKENQALIHRVVDSLKQSNNKPKPNPQIASEYFEKAQDYFNKEQWSLANFYASQTLKYDPSNEEAKIILTKSEEKRKEIELLLSHEKPQNNAKEQEKVDNIQQLKNEYNALVEKGIVAHNNNNRIETKRFFAQAASINDKQGNTIRTTKTNYAYWLVFDTGNRFFQIEEFKVAKEWYQVAQVLNNTAEIREKIKECERKL